MPDTRFFSDLFCFLFSPYRAARECLDAASSRGETGRAEDFARSRAPGGLRARASSHLFVLYLSVLLGVTVAFFVSYPETVYYGTPAEALKKEIPAFVGGFPSFLLMATAGSLLFNFVYSYLLIGFVSFKMMRKMTGAGRDGPDLRRYLAVFAWSFAPLLGWVPLMVYRQFFFERLVLLQPVYPFLDWTAANIAHFLLTGSFLVWKYSIEVRINQALFRTTVYKALVPVMVQAAMLVVLLAVPYLFNQMIYDAFKDIMA